MYVCMYGNVALGRGRGARVLHIVLTTPPCLSDMRLVDVLVLLQRCGFMFNFFDKLRQTQWDTRQLLPVIINGYNSSCSCLSRFTTLTSLTHVVCVFRLMLYHQ